jgi:hypothetical protein
VCHPQRTLNFFLPKLKYDLVVIGCLLLSGKIISFIYNKIKFLNKTKGKS